MTAWSFACMTEHAGDRVPLSKRESLLKAYPNSFGVPPRMEAHHKVEAYLDHAQPRAVRAAIDLAWDMQRH